MHARISTIAALNRLLKRQDFLNAQSSGQKWSAKALTLIAAPNGGKGRRFGITVTRRLEKSAVARNRMKRRLRAAACEILPLLGKDDTDYVLLAREQCATRLFADLKDDMVYCLKKTGSLENNEKNPASGD